MCSRIKDGANPSEFTGKEADSRNKSWFLQPGLIYKKPLTKSRGMNSL